MYSYCHVMYFLLCLCILISKYVPFLGTLSHCVVLCIVFVYICTVLLPPGVNPVAVNKYILSYITSLPSHFTL